MYELNKWYKFQTEGNFFYTGKVIDEDNISIKIITVRAENLIFNKKSIVRSKEMEEDFDGTDNRT